MSTSAKTRVVMIEDNEQNAYLARYLLERGGYAVTVHVNARAGFEAVEKERPDIVLLDIQLPDMDGYAVARKFRSNPGTASIPLVAVSSFAMPGEKARAMEAGCIGYIEKPIKALSFVSQVEGFLKRHAGAS